MTRKLVFHILGFLVLLSIPASFAISFGPHIGTLCAVALSLVVMFVFPLLNRREK